VKKDQRIVITGGSGFIGSFLVEKLIKQGFSNVIVLDKTPKAQTGATYLTCDVFWDSHLIEEYIKKDDIVVHLACTTIPSTSEVNRSRGAEDNIVGSLRLLEVCKKKEIKKFIFASSGGTVYGNSGRKPHTEEDATHPENSYGAIKVALENYLGVYKHLHGMKHVILRIANPYGRKQLVNTKLGVVDIFLRHAMEDKKIVIYGDGKTVRDYIHINDVTDFLVQAIVEKNVEGIYNVGTGVGTSLNQIVREISTLLGRPIEPEFKPKRGVDVKHSVLDIHKARKTGWRPKYDVFKGIRAVHKEILKN
jgi:UDP-glucose 4-epimerase